MRHKLTLTHQVNSPLLLQPSLTKPLLLQPAPTGSADTGGRIVGRVQAGGGEVPVSGSHTPGGELSTTNGCYSGWTSCLLSSTPPGLRPRVPGTCPGNRAAGTTTTSTAASTTTTPTTTSLPTPWPKPSSSRAASTSLSFRRLLFW